jgi:hypothetical protein
MSIGYHERALTLESASGESIDQWILALVLGLQTRRH